MRYELTDYEWTAIKPMLPNKPRGVPRVNDRRVLNGIFWVLRSGAPWRDLPKSYGPPTTCYNRFVRWRQAGVWDRLMNALAAGHDGAVQMIDTSVVRVHQHGACIAGNSEQLMGRSRGGLTTKIHAVVDASGLPVHLALTTGEAHDNRLVLTLLSGLKSGAMLLADRGFDADWIRALASQHGAWGNIPPKRNRTEPICFSPYLYRARNLVERFFNKIKQCRRVATRYDKLAANYPLLSSLRRSDYGCALMSPRPNKGLEEYADILRTYGIKVKLDAGGWFLTDEVQILVHAASYVVNTTDRHAALFLATSPLGRMPLETALKSLVAGEAINLPLLEKLSALSAQLKLLTLDVLIARLITELELYDWALTTSDPIQVRANIVKFEASARDFVTAHRDTLAAAGIHGYGIETFLAWLRHRAELPELDGQPATGDDADAVELVTWHSSKGREWPVVVVSQIDSKIEPRLPSQSIGYANFKDIGNVLAKADLHYAPNFAAPEQCDKFKAILDHDEQRDARRVFYVALTRARETLILEWPDYLLAKMNAEEMKPTYARLLCVDCGFRVDSAGAFFRKKPTAMRLTRVTTGELAGQSSDGSINPIAHEGIGLVAIKRAPHAVPKIPDMISPSMLGPGIAGAESPDVTVHRYGQPIIIPPGLFFDAAEQGTVLHHCVRTLVLRPELCERLFACIGVDFSEEAKTEIKQSAADLRALLDRLDITVIGTEVPILAKRSDGSVMNGLIDLLGRSPKGLFVLDHKSDRVEDPVASAFAYIPQLHAYFEGLTSIYPDAGSVDVAINWLSVGAVALFDGSYFKPSDTNGDSATCRF